MLLCCRKVVYFAFNAVDGNVCLVVLEENPFYSFKHLGSFVTIVLVVVLLTDMNDESPTARLRRLGEALDVSHSDLPLDCALSLDVVQLLVRQQQGPVLGHSELVVFLDNATE